MEVVFLSSLTEEAPRISKSMQACTKTHKAAPPGQRHVMGGGGPKRGYTISSKTLLKLKESTCGKEYQQKSNFRLLRHQPPSAGTPTAMLGSLTMRFPEVTLIEKKEMGKTK